MMKAIKASLLLRNSYETVNITFVVLCAAPNYHKKLYSPTLLRVSTLYLCLVHGLFFVVVVVG